MTNQEKILNTIRVLKGEVSEISKRLKPSGTEYVTNEIRAKTKSNLDTLTAIDVINSRIEELIEEVTAPYWKDEDGDIGRLPGQTRESHLRSIEGAYEEDVYDGFAEHTEAMEQSRLRAIQDSAAGKPNRVRDAYLYSSKQKDDVKHTEEYYDTERNRTPINTFE